MYIHKNGITGHVITVTLSIGEVLAINNTSRRGPGTVKNRAKEIKFVFSVYTLWLTQHSVEKEHCVTTKMAALETKR